MRKDKILVLGGGGREHALCQTLAKSAEITKIYCAPGNYGTGRIAENAILEITDPQAVTNFCKENAIDFVVLGSEAPAAAGVADALTKAGVACFGPSQAAARLESSKSFTKDLCMAAGIPTARYMACDNQADALAGLKKFSLPVVVKADGLASGKGVTVARTLAEAESAVEEIFNGAFGEQSAKLVLEEFLSGEEFSFFVLCDGENAVPFAGARDYKALYDKDEGPNTGGMGAVSPAPLETPERIAFVMEKIIRPTLREMARRGCPFQGVLYAGLMVTAEGVFLIEYNVRFGDPECQVMLPRLRSDLYSLFRACHAGKVTAVKPEFTEDSAVTVVYAAQGYPKAPRKGDRVTLPLTTETGVHIFHAGTVQDEKGGVITSGGRVLNVTALGGDTVSAAKKAYETLKFISVENGFYRSDIGFFYRDIGGEAT